MPLVLGIDTSCDDTGVGIARGDAVLANVVDTQTALHAEFGGVVPEQASREHLAVIDRVVSAALEEAGLQLSDLDAVAATHGPGLVGALLVGLSYGKALAWGLGVPFVPVHHLAGHLAAATTEAPFLALVASGGHTALFEVDEAGNVAELGRSRDDAAGEAFDKVARVLGLPFPGGPHIDRAASDGQISIDFPRGLSSRKDMERHRFDFSFSGLKTAVTRWVDAERAAGRDIPVADVAASFQEAVVDVLTRKAVLACREHDVAALQVGGGVAANTRLREMARQRCEAAGVALRVPRPGLCTDNGAMVASLGAQMMLKGRPASDLSLPADSSLPVTDVRTGLPVEVDHDH